MIVLEAIIEGIVGWNLKHNWSPRNQSKAKFVPVGLLGSVPRPQVSSEPPSDLNLDTDVQGNHAGSSVFIVEVLAD